MLTKEAALSKWKAARDGFWFSLGAYALLTQEPSRSRLSLFEVRVLERNAIDVHLATEPPPPQATGYSIGFNAALDERSALQVVERSFRQMLLESFEVAKEFARAHGIDLSTEPWYRFARHYRNAIAHNGKWNFPSEQGLPVVWRNRTLTSSLNGQPIEGFLSWFEGLQMAAQMNIFISQAKCETSNPSVQADQ